MSKLNINVSGITPDQGVGDIKVDTERVWSPYQNDIFNFIANGRGNAIVDAVAGSGKSSTIIQAMQLVQGTSLFLAFNRAIADELKSKNVNARTFHSLCYGAVLNATKQRSPVPDKLRKLIREHTSIDGNIIRGVGIDAVEVEGITPNMARSYAAFAMKLVGLAKQQGVGVLTVDEYDTWAAIAEHHAIEPEGEGAEIEKGIEVARKLLQWSIDDARIDYDDMLYYPILRGLALPKFDMVFVDEAQDTNMIQREILKRLLKPTSRLIAVGDPSQAIYGFRGADALSMQSIAYEFNAITLPLSISYRCSTSVVKYAQQWVPHIEAAANAPEGSVVALGTEWTPAMFRPDDLVVSRKTAPLISLAFRCIRANVPVQVLGRDIGQGLKTLINKMNSTDLDMLQHKLGKYADRELAKARKEDNEARAQSISDQVNSIIFLIDTVNEDHRTIDGVLAAIDYLFADRGNCVKLSTIHRTKGLEADTVYWLGRNECPATWPTKAWQQQEEVHLCYVAATRAKRNLIMFEL